MKLHQKRQLQKTYNEQQKEKVISMNINNLQYNNKQKQQNKQFNLDNSYLSQHKSQISGNSHHLLLNNSNQMIRLKFYYRSSEKNKSNNNSNQKYNNYDLIQTQKTSPLKYFNQQQHYQNQQSQQNIFNSFQKSLKIFQFSKYNHNKQQEQLSKLKYKNKSFQQLSQRQKYIFYDQQINQILDSTRKKIHTPHKLSSKFYYNNIQTQVLKNHHIYNQYSNIQQLNYSNKYKKTQFYNYNHYYRKQQHCTDYQNNLKINKKIIKIKLFKNNTTHQSIKYIKDNSQQNYNLFKSKIKSKSKKNDKKYITIHTNFSKLFSSQNNYHYSYNDISNNKSNSYKDLSHLKISNISSGNAQNYTLLLPSKEKGSVSHFLIPKQEKLSVNKSEQRKKNDSKSKINTLHVNLKPFIKENRFINSKRAIINLYQSNQNNGNRKHTNHNINNCHHLYNRQSQNYNMRNNFYQKKQKRIQYSPISLYTNDQNRSKTKSSSKKGITIISPSKQKNNIGKLYTKNDRKICVNLFNSQKCSNKNSNVSNHSKQKITKCFNFQKQKKNIQKNRLSQVISSPEVAFKFQNYNKNTLSFINQREFQII